MPIRPTRYCLLRRRFLIQINNFSHNDEPGRIDLLIRLSTLTGPFKIAGNSRKNLDYLEEITDGLQARRIIKDWIAFYNTERPHSALDRLTPDDAYWAGLEEQKAA